MKILAFDQSTTKSGFCLMEDGVLIRHGSFNHSKETKDVPLRIKNMFFDLVALITECHPDVLVVEAAQVQKNAKAALMSSCLQGMLLGVGYLNNIVVYSPLPSQWRKMLEFQQGRRAERISLKQQAFDYVVLNYGIVSKDEDMVEAICIASAIYTILKSNKE